MIKSNQNAIWNARNNEAQTSMKRVLCVCSAGLLRSITLANVLHREFGYNTRNCGTTESFALIPMSEALVAWADEIVFVNKRNLQEAMFNGFDPDEHSVIVLNIPDCYEWMDPKLQEVILEQYKEATKCDS